MTGYSKEKSEAIIKQHEANAKQHEDDANQIRGSGGNHPGSNAQIAEDERAAQKERSKIKNQEELQKHHGDR